VDNFALPDLPDIEYTDLFPALWPTQAVSLPAKKLGTAMVRPSARTSHPGLYRHRRRHHPVDLIVSET